MKDMPPERPAGAQASPAWPAIHASVVSLRADGQSLRWATGELESGATRDRVRVPVLAAYGTSTFPEMVEAAERVRAVLPQTEVREVAGAHHTWDPSAFASVLGRGRSGGADPGRPASVGPQHRRRRGARPHVPAGRGRGPLLVARTPPGLAGGALGEPERYAFSRRRAR